MKEKVLIVGCGDLGQHVAFTLTKSGIHSIGLRRQACASNQVMEMVYADVTQPASLQLLEKMSDIITNLHVLKSIGYHLKVLSNLIKKLNLLVSDRCNYFLLQRHVLPEFRNSNQCI